MLVLTETLKKGINVQKEMFIFEVAYQQYNTSFKANFIAGRKEQPKPFTDEFVDKALTAYTDAKLLLREFLKCVEKIHNLKEDLRRYASLAEKFNEPNGLYAKEAKLLKPFIESISEQAYLVPIVESVLNQQ